MRHRNGRSGWWRRRRRPRSRRAAPGCSPAGLAGTCSGRSGSRRARRRTGASRTRASARRRHGRLRAPPAGPAPGPAGRRWRCVPWWACSGGGGGSGVCTLVQGGGSGGRQAVPRGGRAAAAAGGGRRGGWASRLQQHLVVPRLPKQGGAAGGAGQGGGRGPSQVAGPSLRAQATAHPVATRAGGGASMAGRAAAIRPRYEAAHAGSIRWQPSSLLLCFKAGWDLGRTTSAAAGLESALQARRLVPPRASSAAATLPRGPCCTTHLQPLLSLALSRCKRQQQRGKASWADQSSAPPARHSPCSSASSWGRARPAASAAASCCPAGSAV